MVFRGIGGACASAIVCVAPATAQPVAATGYQVRVMQDGAPLEGIAAVLATGDEVFVADSAFAGTGSTIFRFDPGTGTIAPLTGLPEAIGISDMVQGDGTLFSSSNIYVSDNNVTPSGPGFVSCCEGVVFEIDRVTGASSVLTVGNPTFAPPGDPAGLDIVKTGGFARGLYVMDFQGASPNPPVLYRVNSGGGATTVYFDEVALPRSSSPQRIEYGGGGDYGDVLMIVDANGSSGARVWKLAPDHSLTLWIPNDPGLTVGELELAPAGFFGGRMYGAAIDGSVRGVAKINPDGSRDFIVTGTTVKDLSIAPDGRALYFAEGATLYQVLCSTDWNANGIGDTSDFIAYLNDFNDAMGGGSPTYADPDIAEPFGVLNTADFVEFLNRFTLGCD